MFIRRIFYIILFACTFQCRQVFSEVYFSQECKSRILDLINDSDKEIRMAVYSIDDKDIVDALFQFIDRGGDLKIITDRVQASGRQSRSPEIYSRVKDNLKINSNKFRIMHDKFAIFDSKLSVNGSFNWTYSAANRNAEDCRISDNKDEINKFYQRFNSLWDIFSSEETSIFFSELNTKREIKKKLETMDVNGNLDKFINGKRSRSILKQIKPCRSYCEKKCLKKEIIKYNMNQIKSGNIDNLNTENLPVNSSILSKKKINVCKIKCKKKCIKRFLVKQILYKKSNKKSNITIQKNNSENVYRRKLNIKNKNRIKKLKNKRIN